MEISWSFGSLFLELFEDNLGIIGDIILYFLFVF